jgi:hypothetical protein
MATEKQKEAARQNLKAARKAQSSRANGNSAPRKDDGLATAEKNRLADTKFAFPKERKEPLTDASHVRNAIARFDQVEGVTDAERDAAWKRIKTAARKHGVDVSADSWRELGAGGRAKKSTSASHK